MVRSEIIGANSSAHHRSIARGNSAGLGSRFLSFSFYVAASLPGTSDRRSGRLAIHPGTARRLRVATGCVGIGGASGACGRLRSRMAGPALFFRSGWLGTFEHAAKFKRTSIGAVADESNRALSARKSCRLARVDPAELGN